MTNSPLSHKIGIRYLPKGRRDCIYDLSYGHVKLPKLPLFKIFYCIDLNASYASSFLDFLKLTTSVF